MDATLCLRRLREADVRREVVLAELGLRFQSTAFEDDRVFREEHERGDTVAGGNDTVKPLHGSDDLGRVGHRLLCTRPGRDHGERENRPYKNGCPS